MPGHNGLFARQLPIAFSYSEYADPYGFDRRRFDLFVIIQLTLQSYVGSLFVS